MRVHMDKRTARTKRAIRYAFARLVSEKNIGDISVGEIAELAKVSRGTFYVHYKSIPDMLMGQARELKIELSEHIRQTDENGAWSVERAIGNMLVFFSKDAIYYSVTFGENGNPGYRQVLSESIKEILVHGGSPIDRALSYRVGGMSSLICDWIVSPNTDPLELAHELLEQGF